MYTKDVLQVNTSVVSNIVNPGILSKARWCTSFGWTMMKYAFYVTTSQIEGGGQGDTHIDVRMDRQMNIIG